MPGPKGLCHRPALVDKMPMHGLSTPYCASNPVNHALNIIIQAFTLARVTVSKESPGFFPDDIMIITRRIKTNLLT